MDHSIGSLVVALRIISRVVCLTEQQMEFRKVHMLSSIRKMVIPMLEWLLFKCPKDSANILWCNSLLLWSKV